MDGILTTLLKVHCKWRPLEMLITLKGYTNRCPIFGVHPKDSDPGLGICVFSTAPQGSLIQVII